MFIFWPCWIFTVAWAFSQVVLSVGYSLVEVCGFSLWWLLLLRITGPAHVGFSPCGSRALGHRLNNWGHRLSCSVACQIFPDQGSNLCLLHRQADSLPLSHQGSLAFCFRSEEGIPWQSRV